MSAIGDWLCIQLRFEAAAVRIEPSARDPHSRLSGETEVERRVHFVYRQVVSRGEGIE